MTISVKFGWGFHLNGPRRFSLLFSSGGRCECVRGKKIGEFEVRQADKVLLSCREVTRRGWKLYLTGRREYEITDSDGTAVGSIASVGAFDRLTLEGVQYKMPYVLRPRMDELGISFKRRQLLFGCPTVAKCDTRAGLFAVLIVLPFLFIMSNDRG